MSMTFESFFSTATGNPEAFPYQRRFATGETLPQLLSVPTGVGKTATAVLGWLWRRRFADCDTMAATPRRLVYCLPMRTLVEQTRNECLRWLDHLNLLAGDVRYLNNDQSQPIESYSIDIGADKEGKRIGVHVLMGGEDRTDWALWPEHDAILIGTQDMLLSRALNRGYAAGRARWPLEFGVLHNDCLWVFDEVQLMSTGLATSLQLDAWHRRLHLRKSSSARATSVDDPVAKPCRSLWLSATMAHHWLESAVDWARLGLPATAWNDRLQLGKHKVNGTSVDDFTNDDIKAIFKNRKSLTQTAVTTVPKPKGKGEKIDHREYVSQVCESIREHHSTDGLTLVIVNTVERAVDLYSALTKANLNVTPRLIHSRFRPEERKAWARLFDRNRTEPSIIVSTQVVEAGVDISASVLFTELAPWASLVQRFGRCARRPGENGTVYWMDLDLGTPKQRSESAGLPYTVDELSAAKTQLERLPDVGLKTLIAVRKAIEKDANKMKKLFLYNPQFVPREKDLFDLFDTTPDLTGADVDISRFIRDGEELDVQVFWRDVPTDETLGKRLRPQRRELCTVPAHQFRGQLRGLRRKGRIWRRDYRKGWVPLGSDESEKVFPGQVFLLDKSCGGYSTEIGWTGDSNHTNFATLAPDPRTSASPQANPVQDEDEDAENSEATQWLSVLDHTRNVCRKLNDLTSGLHLEGDELDLLELAARWHDRGKAHPSFLGKLKPAGTLLADGQPIDECYCIDGQPIGKAPDSAWRPIRITKSETRDAHKLLRALPEAVELRFRRRPGFRHELASALAVLETLKLAGPDHPAFAWPESLGSEFKIDPGTVELNGEAASELTALSVEDFNLLLYLVACHHGKVRMSLRSAPDDAKSDVPDPCPERKRQARGVRDGDSLPACLIPAKEIDGDPIEAPEITSLNLDPMELGLSRRYGPSWRERMQLLLDHFGPFRLAYLESLIIAADRRASQDERLAISNTESTRTDGN